jgi:hypothetical protein
LRGIPTLLHLSEHPQLFTQSKAAKREKAGRFFLLFIVLSCIGLLGWGASRVENKDYDFKKGANRTDTNGKPIEASPASFILSFCVGQVGGWFFWFFLWIIVFKTRYVPVQWSGQGGTLTQHASSAPCFSASF